MIISFCNKFQYACMIIVYHTSHTRNGICNDSFSDQLNFKDWLSALQFIPTS